MLLLQLHPCNLPQPLKPRSYKNCIKMYAAFNVYLCCSIVTDNSALDTQVFVVSPAGRASNAEPRERKTLISPPKFLFVVTLLAFEAGSAQYFKPLARCHTALRGESTCFFVRNMVEPFSIRLSFRAETQSSHRA